MSQAPWFPHPSLPVRQPGLVPLRPLTISEVLGLSFRMARRHFARLGPLALLASLLGSAVVWGVLAATGTIDAYIDASWIDAALSGTELSLPPAGISIATLAQLIVDGTTTVLIAGVAAVYVGQDVLGTSVSTQERRARLAGPRLWQLVGVSVLAGAGIAVGFAFLIVPGLLLMLAWFVVGPALVMERGTPGVALRRSLVLTRGSWGRLLGLAVALLAIGLVLSILVSSLVAPLTASASDLAALLVADLAGAVVAMVTTSWGAAAMALSYVDLRIRTENFAVTLSAAAGS
ncbi:hypothetical protein ABLG96_16405 [Nakamurella sp. A5-74]|uniref:Glycerophosphoryl diester phosphodiesterase membrane domain-containing protein n=1 Tax=Nakamurella sp. A5-74 TaxID=3158264 RepID=A0AAU8DLD2_9ACTN